jgi:hypothetical protein
MKLIVMLLVMAASIYSQDVVHRWKQLVIDDKEKVWYDQSMTDSIKGSKMNIWILQMHKPPLTGEGINGEVYRSKTLYAINLKTAKYGILNVIYYDVANKEMYNFKYNIDDYPESLKYTYPITEKSFLFALLKELFNKPGDKTN